VRTWKEVRDHDRAVTEDQVRATLVEFSALWDELFPAEQSRIIQLLVERVEIQPDGLSIKLRKDGFLSLANELRQTKTPHGARSHGISPARRA
jgi:site-specific DNA recombinase